MAVAVNLPNPATRVIEEPPGDLAPLGGYIGNILISVASAADTIPAWGTNMLLRDAELRAFWPTEPFFASALYSTVSQYVALGYKLDGPPRTVAAVQNMLNSVEMGKGWEGLMVPYLIDLFTQDNGAFIEIVREDNDYRAPVVSLNHLDAARCRRTGRHEAPVIYVDARGNYHRLAWYDVIASSEFPSPIEQAYGMQYSALTRVLRSCQVARDIGIVNHEKASGRFTRQVHIVGGIQSAFIENAMRQKQRQADAAGLMRYIEPLIVAGVDPTARVTLETIDLASVPDMYDEQKAMQVYLTILAMGFGTDYQNLAPLPGGGLGSASQSKVLNMKSRGKGAALFIKQTERLFNFNGLLPRSVTLKFGDQDIAEQMERTELRKARALEREIRVRTGEITTEVARQIAVDQGDLDERYLVMMQEANATASVTAISTEPVSTEPGSGPVKEGMAGPLEPPGGNIDRPENSNAERTRGPVTNQRRIPGGTPEAGARP